MTRVMVVDDDVTVREVVVTYLRAAGHEVERDRGRRGRRWRCCATTRPTWSCST